MSEAIKKIDSLFAGCSPGRFFCKESSSPKSTAITLAASESIPIATPLAEIAYEVNPYDESFNQELGEKIYAVFCRHFTTIKPEMLKQIELIADKLDTFGRYEFQEELEAFLEDALKSKNPGSLRNVIEGMIVLMEQSSIEPAAVEEFRADFLDLCELYKNNSNLVTKMMEKVEVFLFFVTKANRLARNLCRIVAALSSSPFMVGLTTMLGAGNFISAVLDVKEMLGAVWNVIIPGKTKAQRMGALWDILKYASYALEDLSIAMHALTLWLKDNPHLAAFTGIGIYFSIAAICSAVAKNCFDLFFYNKLLEDLKNDPEALEDYGKIKEKWLEKIQEYGKVVGFLIKACGPDFLKVLEDFDDQLQIQGYINAPETTQNGNMLPLEANKGVRNALIGRVTDKISNNKWGLLSNVIDLFAISLFLTAPLSGGISIAGAGVLLSKSTLIGIYRWKHNADSQEKFHREIAIAVKGIDRGDAHLDFHDHSPDEQ